MTSCANDNLRRESRSELLRTNHAANIQYARDTLRKRDGQEPAEADVQTYALDLLAIQAGRHVTC